MNTETVTIQQILDELKEIKALLSKPEINEHSREIWDIQKIADYFGFSYEHTAKISWQAHIFPPPLI